MNFDKIVHLAKGKFCSESFAVSTGISIQNLKYVFKIPMLTDLSLLTLSIALTQVFLLIFPRNNIRNVRPLKKLFKPQPL